MERTRVLIMGAAGRDFHNFNVYFRDNSQYEVAAFTAAQIPDIEGRVYPPELAGEFYPEGIPIYSEDELDALIRDQKIDQVIFAYSDIPHREVMHKASIVNASGADFIIIGAQYTMLKSEKPMISVCAVRTGCGKSQTSRHVVRILQKTGRKVVSIRHPMPYGDFVSIRHARATVNAVGSHRTSSSAARSKVESSVRREQFRMRMPMADASVCARAYDRSSTWRLGECHFSPLGL